MPDVGIPAKIPIWGKKPSEIAKLFSHVTDYTTMATYLDKLWSVSDAGDILEHGYMNRRAVDGVFKDGGFPHSKIRQVLAAGSRKYHIWITGAVSDLNTAVSYPSGGGGTNPPWNTSFLAYSFGGETSVGKATQMENFTDDAAGGVWTNYNDMNTAVYIHSSSAAPLYGYGTADLYSFGGTDAGGLTAECEYFDSNGSDLWETAGVGDLNTALNSAAGCGGYDVGYHNMYCISFGGSDGANKLTATEEFCDDTSTWNVAGGGDLNTGSMFLSGCGTYNAALAINGIDPSNLTNRVEKWAGNYWVVDVDTNFADFMSRSLGTVDSCMLFGGINNGGTTQYYNGIVWLVCADSDLNSDVATQGGSGDWDRAISFGGNAPGRTVTTEEFI